MPSVTINNVDIDFPFSPYECQKDYMGHVIKALQLKQNAILESPTGTGKTLCLLCSVLAWRLTYIAKLQLKGLAPKGNVDGLEAAAGGEGTTEAFTAIPKIIYASRTHSQITQVVKELKNTIYKPKVSVLGSRDQLCLHPKVMNLENTMAKIHTCRAKVKERSCEHYTNVDRKINDNIFNEIMDIEDLVSVSKEKKMCPYYSSRELLRRADIIFMPYNYLIDSRTRKNQNIGLENAIVIFDEAHNIEKVCEESYSFELTSLDIANCIENCQVALQRILDEDSDGSDSNELTKEDVLTMKAIFLSLEREFNKLEVKGNGGIIDKSTFKNLLTSISVNEETKDLVTDVLQKMESVLSMSNNKIIGNTFAVLNNFMQILDLTLNQKDTCRQQYVCYVSKEKVEKGPRRIVNKVIESVAPRFYTKLSYWCFSPGLAMEEFVRQGVYSVILTSGTLSPLSSFSSELKVPFPITLQNPHVIEPCQITVQVFCKGCDGEDLISTYKNRSNPKYLNSLGNTIVNLLRVVPDGVLVFFPSYGVMNATLQSWQNSNIYSRIMKVKTCFTEPRSKNEMSAVMTEFDSKVRNPESGTTGAILFAVCRGKASEGIDFADMHGRAVIITGLPFPPKIDPKVSAKINFLDQQKRVRKESLNGNEWYIQQSSRAVNQAVGRVIRHKDDFGAVLFMDKRFSFRSNIDELPKWMKDSVCVNEKFGSGIRELSMFFRVHVVVPPKVEEGEKASLYQEYNYRVRLKEMKDKRKEAFHPELPELESSTHEVTPPPRKMARLANRASLITSLNSTDSAGFSYTSSLSPVSSKVITDYKTPEQLKNRAKTRKIQLITSKPEKENILVTPTKPSVEIKKETSEEKLEHSRIYSAKIKKAFSVEESREFKKIMNCFKATKNIDNFIEEMGTLFLRGHHRELLIGLKIFISSKDRPKFDAYLAKHIKQEGQRSLY